MKMSDVHKKSGVINKMMDELHQQVRSDIMSSERLYSLDDWRSWVNDLSSRLFEIEKMHRSMFADFVETMKDFCDGKDTLKDDPKFQIIRGGRKS